MTIQEMIERKKELGYTNKTLSEASGVPVGTLQKLFAGITKAPRIDTIEALTKVLEKPRLTTYEVLKEVPGQPGYVRETVNVYAETRPEPKRKLGPYTLEDYYALPDDRRAELIDGVLYDMAAPSYRHQAVLGALFRQIYDCIEREHAGCTVLFAPFDVQLDMDEYTMVQPDLIVLCDKTGLTNRGFKGAPDFVAEVVSRASRKHDGLLKLTKYLQAGVREYWIIDPMKETVTVYVFGSEDRFLQIYERDAVIPLAISDDHCAVDFRQIFDRAAALPEE